MKNVIGVIKTAIIAFGAAVGAFIGRADGLLIGLISLCVADYITGVVAAAVNHRLNSAVGFRGIAKKLFMFTLVGVGNVIDVNALAGTAVLRSAIICFYLANEALSIIENAGEIGLPVPKKLKQLLDNLKEKNDKEQSDDQQNSMNESERGNDSGESA